MTLRGIRVWKVKVSFPSFFLLDFLLSSTSRLERPEGFNANNLGQFSLDRLDGQHIKFGSDGNLNDRKYIEEMRCDKREAFAISKSLKIK